MSRRRRSSLLLATALNFVALHAGAQAPVVGLMSIGSPTLSAGTDQQFSDGLRKLGYVTGQSIVIEPRWAYGDITRYPALARELIARRPAVILAPCGPSLKAIREISRTVPVIAFCADEKNFLGEIASLSRPGGHTTGMTFLSPESVGKRLELLREVLPGFSRLAVLFEPNDPIDSHWRELERLQSTFGLSYQRLPIGHAEELEPAFAAMVRERTQAVFVFPSNRMIAERTRIADLARKHRIASVFELSLAVDVGGLLSYGWSVSEFIGRSAPMYVDKILKGAKPGDLPVLQATRFDLVVNQKTAREIGVKIPQSILARADRVIE